METPEWTVDYDECERCHDFATHRLYWGDELMHCYCSPCLNIVHGAREEVWREIAHAAATPADGPLTDLTYQDIIGHDPETDQAR